MKKLFAILFAALVSASVVAGGLSGPSGYNPHNVSIDGGQINGVQLGNITPIPSLNGVAAANMFSGKLVKFSIITASNASWAKQPETNRILVLLCGGGGGGGGVPASAGFGGLPGQAGEFVFAYTESPSATYNVTIGAGGAGGIGNTSSGGNGGTTSFGALASAAGGAGHWWATQSTIGGAAEWFDGERGIGKGGLGKNNANALSAGSNSCAGGGATHTNTTTAYNGGAGGSGVAFVWEYQ